MIYTLITSYALQMTAVALILLGCLLWMFLSIRKRFKTKERSGTCAGCNLYEMCSKPKKGKSSSDIPQK